MKPTLLIAALALGLPLLATAQNQTNARHYKQRAPHHATNVPSNRPDRFTPRLNHRHVARWNGQIRHEDGRGRIFLGNWEHWQPGWWYYQNYRVFTYDQCYYYLQDGWLIPAVGLNLPGCAAFYSGPIWVGLGFNQ